MYAPRELEAPKALRKFVRGCIQGKVKVNKNTFPLRVDRAVACNKYLTLPYHVQIFNFTWKAAKGNERFPRFRAYKEIISKEALRLMKQVAFTNLSE